MKLCECNIGDKVKIVGGLLKGCYDCNGKIGFIIPLGKAIILQNQGTYWCGWSPPLHPEELIGCVYNTEYKTLYIMNNDCAVELLKKNEKDRKDMKDMKDFRIVDYKVYNKKALKVTFKDAVGMPTTEVKAVCNDEDCFDLMRGLEVCVLKHILGEDTYKQIIKEISRQIKAIEDAAKAKKDEEERIAKKKAKNDIRMAKRRAKIQLLEDERKAKQRQERIDEMKEAYLAALKEYNGNIDFDKEEIVTEQD